MSGKEVECCGEDGKSGRKPGRTGRRRRARREEMTEKGKEVQFYGGKPEDSSGQEEEWYWEDGVAYAVCGGRHEMTKRESDEYEKKVEESEGYDVDCNFNSFSYGGIGRYFPENDYYRGRLEFMAKLALGEYNEDKGMRLELNAFQKANRGHSKFGLKHYITFDVFDPDDDANPIKVFQAQVVSTFKKGVYKVDQVRPKPGVYKVDQVRPKPTAA